MNRRRFRMNRRMWGINPRSIGMFDVHFGTCRADYLDDCFEERNFWHMRRHACTGGFWYDDGNRNCVLRDTDYNGRFTGNHNSNIHNNDNSVEMMDNRNVNVFRNSNSGANSNGTDNNGRITDNRNSYINYEESSVEIVDNRNVFIDIVRSTVKVIDQSNCKLLATASNIEMRSNSNVNVEADDAWCKFEDNNNLDYKGTGGASEFQSKFVDNRNCDIGGKNNNILASNNNNLSVAGDVNHLEISRTRNHNVQSTPLGSNENTFTVSSSGRSSIQFDISYAGAAVINERKYLLGIFGFDVVTGFDRVNVTLTGDDGVTYSVVNSSPMKVVLQAEKNDVVQTLELCGERVETVTTNSINIFVNSM